MENNQYVWYKDPTVWLSSGACLLIGIGFSVVSSLQDGRVNLGGLYLMGGGAVVIVGFSWLFRKNP